jgi:Bacterial trigger factor protein (TF)
MVLAFRVSPPAIPQQPCLHSPRSPLSFATTSTTTTLWNAKVATAKVYTSTAVAIVPLFPEPSGGTELLPLVPDTSSSIGVSRMKQLDTILPSSSSSSMGSPVYEFWMTTYTDGKSIQEIRQTILKDASKKANFPGFRKGQVPPYAQPQITQFAIQESIIKKVEQMVLDYGLQSISGSDGQVQVHEDVSEMTKLYKTGTSIQFTATLRAKYDETKLRPPTPTSTALVEPNDAVVMIEAVEPSIDATTIAPPILVETVAEEMVDDEVETVVPATPTAGIEDTNTMTESSYDAGADNE